MKNKINQIGIVFLLTLTLSCSKSNENTQNIHTTCLPANLQNGVITFYPFSNGSLNDYSGNSYNLTNSTTASSGADREGNPNCAYNFVKANGEFLTYVNPTFINNFQTLPFSISLWYKPIGLWSGTTGLECLISRNTGEHCPVTFGEWSVTLGEIKKPFFGINEHYTWFDANTSTPIYTDVWQHLVVTCLGNDLKIYRNGVLSILSTQDGSGTNCNSPSQPTLNIGDLFLGKNYNGLLDDVIVFNRVLSPAEINQLYNLPACCE